MGQKLSKNCKKNWNRQSFNPHLSLRIAFTKIEFMEKAIFAWQKQHEKKLSIQGPRRPRRRRKKRLFPSPPSSCSIITAKGERRRQPRRGGFIVMPFYFLLLLLLRGKWGVVWGGGGINGVCLSFFLSQPSARRGISSCKKWFWKWGHYQISGCRKNI